MADPVADIEVGIEPGGADVETPEPALVIEAEQAAVSEALVMPESEPPVEMLQEMETYTPERFPTIPTTICEIREAEFRGSFPEVPFASGVDYAALIEGDEKPFFVTLPIAEVGVVSANKLRYTAELVQSLVDQINSDKPSGIRGHIKDAERSTAYPNPEIFWVGATLQDQTAWGKAYFPPGPAREEYRIKKATGAKAATSIYGKPLLIREYKDGTYTPVLSLEQVDLAPTKRAATGQAYDFAVTREMSQEQPGMDAETMRAQLGQMTLEDLIDALGDEKAEALAEMCAKKKNKKMVAMEMVEVEPSVIAELEQGKTLANETIAELTQRKNDLETVVAGYRRAEFDGAVDAAIVELTNWNATTDNGKQRLASLRTLLKGGVVSEMGESRDVTTVAETAQRVFDANRPIAEAIRDVLAGPPAIVTGVSEMVSQPRIPTAEEIEAARARTGIGMHV